MNRFLSCQALLKLSVSETKDSQEHLHLALNLWSQTLRKVLHARPTTNTPKLVPRNAPPKRNLPSTFTANSLGSISTKNPCSAVATRDIPPSSSGQKDKEGVESLSIAVLQEISSKLNSVAERVVRMETQLDALENRRTTPSSSSDARTPKQKCVIPHTLCVLIVAIHNI